MILENPPVSKSVRQGVTGSSSGKPECIDTVPRVET